MGVDPDVTTPRPLEPIHRRGARILLLDTAGRLLLLRGHDPAGGRGHYWFTVGGGLKPGETPRQAAVRELYEETGLRAPAEALTGPIWHEVTEFPFNNRWYRQEQDFFVLRVPEWTVTPAGLETIEQVSIDGFRWWTCEELESTTETYYPVKLPMLVRLVLEGGEA